MTVRIGFLFNHFAGHQVAHSLPIAAALARLHPDVEVSLFVSEGAAEVEVRRLWLAAGFAPENGRVIALAPAGAFTQALTALTGNALPADRLSILARNKDNFAPLDALVTPEKTATLLKTRLGMRDLALVHTRHGAGDRAIGFDNASAQFDLVLLSGAKIRDRLAAAGLLRDGGSAIVGYPKFDLQGAAADRTPLFDNCKPTVLYNPHPSPALSSWYQHGPNILNWFAAQDRYNLVFAPHVMLFAKRWNFSLSPFAAAKVSPVPPAIFSYPHIRIDTGSVSSLDMTYTNRADIYLGDASSQVYEFLRFPRPCIFWDAKGQDWQGDINFLHWEAGSVVGNIAELEIALDSAVLKPDQFRTKQEELFAYSFDISTSDSGERAAAAIIEWLESNRGCPAKALQSDAREEAA